MFDWLKKNSNNFGRGPAKVGTMEYAEQQEARRQAEIKKMTNPSFSEEGMRVVCDMYFNEWAVRSRQFQDSDDIDYAKELQRFLLIKNKNLVDELKLMGGASDSFSEHCLKITKCRADASAFKDAFDECYLFTCKVARHQKAQQLINS